MSKKINKTNAMRQLDSAQIAYSFAEYECNEENNIGEHAAEQVGCSADEMFKTLVARGDDKQIFVYVIPVGASLNLKKAASASGNKKIEMIHVKEIFDLTGYIRGGCSPIGMKKLYPTYIDETAVLFDQIYASGGRRGLSLRLNPDELKDFVNAEYADLID